MEEENVGQAVARCGAYGSNIKIRFIRDCTTILDKLRDNGTITNMKAKKKNIVETMKIKEAGRKQKNDVPLNMLHEEFEETGYYVDDVDGSKLDKNMVKKARKEAMTVFKEMRVYEYVKRADIVNKMGKKIVGVIWVDVAKNGAVRSRLVAQEFASKDDRDRIFVGTHTHHHCPQ